jgi:hypothetical protein
VLLRFRVASDAGTTSPGWDLDQIEVEGIENAPFDLVVAQPAACVGSP